MFRISKGISRDHYGSQGLILFVAEAVIFQAHKVHIMAVDALAPCVARSSVAIVLAAYNNWVLDFHVDEFQLPVPSECL